MLKIRFRRVLARGTSEYAYVGSGKVHRIGNRQMAVFSEGQKINNADLSASYNLGARYWMREITDHSKSLGRNAQVVQGDKSSLCMARHQQTLASLISLARSLPQGNVTVPAPHPSQCHFREETANRTA
jgi:hypothetical protein